MVVQPGLCQTGFLARKLLCQSRPVCVDPLRNPINRLSTDKAYLEQYIMGKPAFCICENKDADQLRGNHKADQRLCFRYMASPSTFKIRNFMALAIFCSCTAWFESEKDGHQNFGFLMMLLIYKLTKPFKLSRLFCVSNPYENFIITGFKLAQNFREK